ncbi:MAG: hypothetical protein ACJASQ_003361 [Crocinitomicaceae bacterium]|jgi:hypothetical protein
MILLGCINLQYTNEHETVLHKDTMLSLNFFLHDQNRLLLLSNEHSKNRN